MIFSNFPNLFSISKTNENSSTPNSGLTFVGVGPGDPDLLTIAAVNAISKASLVAYPVAGIGKESMALNIASEFVKHKKCLPIFLPMIKDIKILQRAWIDAGKQLVKEVCQGKEVVFLSQGDPSLYSTSSYLLLFVKERYPSLSVKVIPGVSSFNAAAAAAKLPLSLQKEDLLLASAPDEPEKLNALLDEVIFSNKVLILLKLGSRWKWIKEIISKKNLLENTLLAQRVGFSDEVIVKGSEVDLKNTLYFSLLIVRKNPDYVFY